jgi:hypothetical protein
MNETKQYALAALPVTHSDRFPNAHPHLERCSFSLQAFFFLIFFLLLSPSDSSTQHAGTTEGL